jgi:hypothetical protein
VLREKISVKLSASVLLISLSALTVLHGLILIGLVPANIVWGGQINDTASNVLRLELVALVLTLAFVLIVAAKVGIIKPGKYKRLTGAGTWVFFTYLIVNSVVNLAAGAAAERFVFAPITLIMAVFAFRLALEN